MPWKVSTLSLLILLIVLYPFGDRFEINTPTNHFQRHT